MNAYLSLRRPNGRTRDSHSQLRRRLVSLVVRADAGYRCATARCYFGGMELATLWNPSLFQTTRDGLVLQGFERLGEQALVQEWIVEAFVNQSPR